MNKVRNEIKNGTRPNPSQALGKMIVSEEAGRNYLSVLKNSPLINGDDKEKKVPKILGWTPLVLRDYIEATRNVDNLQINETSERLKKYILDRVEEAIDKLYEKDIFLLNREMNEVTVCGRFAIYLQELFKNFKGYYVDIEYYRLKVPEDKIVDKRTDRIRCDILLHSREYYERRVDNLLAIEVKLDKNVDDGKDDMCRLSEFALPEAPDTPPTAVHSTLVCLYLRFDEGGYGGVLLSPHGYTKKSVKPKALKK